MKGENFMKMAIIGAGGIARTMAYTMNRMEEVECYAVAARDYE
jgi:ornithine cyclodeaminase/alanine dehydrogenase-like protein (mu-crystallin family)